MSDLLRTFITEVLAEANIKARKPDADWDSDETETWIGDDKRVLRALARAGVSGVEREHIMAGTVPVSQGVLSMLRRDAGLKRDPSERKSREPKPYDWTRSEKSRSRARRAAENKFNAAVKKFAKNWTDFKAEMPDVAPEDAAFDAASGFFYEYPEWKEWLSAMRDTYSMGHQMTKQDMLSVVADCVHDAMTRGK